MPCGPTTVWVVSKKYCPHFQSRRVRQQTNQHSNYTPSHQLLFVFLKVIWICYSRSQISQAIFRSGGSAVVIVNGYGLNGRGVGVWVPVGTRIFSSRHHSDRLWGPPRNRNRGSFLGGKAVLAWSWPLTSNQCRGKEYVELNIHSPHTSSWRSA
jgi:hypothetical protein